MINPKSVQECINKLQSINIKLDEALANNSSNIKQLRACRESIIHYLESQGAHY